MKNQLVFGAAVLCLLAAPIGSSRAADAKPPAAKTAAEQQAEFEANFEKGLLTVPVYRVMKEHYPDVYAASLKEGLENLRAGKSMLVLQGQMRTAYAALLKSQLPKAEPSLVYSMIELARTETEGLMNSPDDCMGFVGLRPLKTRVDLLLSPELAQQDLKLSAQILLQTATHPYSRPSDRKHELATPAQLASIAYDAFLTDDSRKRFLQIAGNIRGVTDPADERVVCEYMVGFFTALLKQTPEDAAAIYSSSYSTDK